MALSANATYELRNTKNMIRGSMQIHTAAKIYKHAIVVVQGTDGVCGPAVNGTSSHFLGLAVQGETTSLAAALTTATYITNCEARLPIISGISAGMVGDTILAYDDAQAGITTTNGPPIGRMTAIDGTSYVWVWLGHLTLGSAS